MDCSSYCIICCIFSYCYGDIIITAGHGIGVWESLFNGSITNYYYDMKGTAIYSFPLYIVFALWDLLLYIIKCFCRVELLDSRVLLAYAKSILIPFLIGLAFIIYKIYKNIEIYNLKFKWCVFYFLSSSFVTFSLLI